MSWNLNPAGAELSPEDILAPISTADWVAIWAPIAEMCALHPRSADGTSLWRGIDCGALAGARFATGSQLIKRGKRQALTPNGALVILNLLAKEDSPDPLRLALEDRPFFDVSRDNQITPIDALQIVNHLARSLPLTISITSESPADDDDDDDDLPLDFFDPAELLP